MAAASAASSLVPVVCSSSRASATPKHKRNHFNRTNEGRVSSDKKLGRNNLNVVGGGGLTNVVEVVKKDFAFLEKNLSKGLKWANEAFKVKEVSKTVEDFVWVRNVEDSKASFLKFPTWPQPYYAELSGVDLFMADLKALEVYAGYYYHLAKMWTKPLPEIYDTQEVSDYFALRPHVVALRVLEVFSAFVSATIKLKLSRINAASDDFAHEKVSEYNFGMILKETMLNLGPTFIKVGQSLSTRPDIIGAEVSKALSELHDQIPPFSRAEAIKIIEEELGSPIETSFSYISEETVAAASFGQVYKARTLDGFEVAVKVQRPELRPIVVRDIYILRLALGVFQRLAKRKSDPRLYADELGRGFTGELDYTLEAANALEFKEVHSRFPFIYVPKVYQHLSNRRVLTMEWMTGDNPTDLFSSSSWEAKQKLLDLVNKGVEATLVQLLETGLLHADPHPGNLRYTSSEKIGFLDFGLICRMEKKHQFAMLSAIVHIVNGDWSSLVHDLTEMDVIRPGTNIRRFTWDLEDALGDLDIGNGVPDVKFSRVLGKIWAVALKYHCRMPPYFVLVLRSLASLEGLAVATDPTFKTFEAAYPYVVQKLLVDNSAASRKILQSVVFNRSREFQWERIAFFLKIGATRKRLNSLVPSNPPRTSLTQSSASEIAPEVSLANLALRILPSKNGVVLRRLLMNADGASSIKAIISNEASPFRKQLSKILADVIYKWMCKVLEKNLNLSLSDSRDFASHISSSAPVNDEHTDLIKDRRLRIIFLKSLNSAKRDPMLMLRFGLASFLMFFVASASACHRVVVLLVGSYLDRVSYDHPKRITSAV